MTTLNKSLYLAGVQCLKRLYFLVHQPELAAKVDAAAESIIEQGHEIGFIARKLFPDGVGVNEDNLDLAIGKTQELLADPTVPAIFEGTFVDGGALVKVDILHRRGDGRWRIIEVKSTAEVKDHHLEDVAIQHRVISHSGVDVASVCLAHVNRNYVYSGGEIDVRRFFRIKNLTRRVNRLEPKLAFQLRSEFTVLVMPKPPDISPGRHCNDPIVCEFYAHCNPPRSDDHIGFLPRIHPNAVEQLEEMGIESIHDIPDHFELTEIQRRAATCVQTGEPWFDHEGLKAELGKLEYPLFFMDFESVNPCVPRFVGMRPYDQVCFQYSVHVVREPGAALEHFEFLAADGRDPRRGFISSLSELLGDTGSVLVYNAAFESLRLGELGAWLPEYAERITGIQSRLFDLLPIIRNHVYHPAFAGSYSIKSVLPALVPDMSYEGMQVADGRQAGVAWESLVRSGLDRDERERIEEALRAYCGQDTLALVRLLDKLQNTQTHSQVSRLI